jgi:hypothetical protein
MRLMWTICASLLLVLMQSIVSAASLVEPFDQSTWRSLTHKQEQAALVIFTSVTCIHCPAAIKRLAAKRSAIAPHIPLVVVSMDAENNAALLQDAHYAPADRLFLFRGRSQALQFSVNPEWRGMTPYVGFIDRRGAVHFSLGEPRDDLLSEWLRSQ